MGIEQVKSKIMFHYDQQAKNSYDRILVCPGTDNHNDWYLRQGYRCVGNF